VLPSEKDPRDGWIDIAAIPEHIKRTGRRRPRKGRWYPFLRYGIRTKSADVTVVLTKAQAVKIRDSITDWLEGFSKPKDGECL
jgi:hypothetical protein